MGLSTSDTSHDGIPSQTRNLPASIVVCPAMMFVPPSPCSVRLRVIKRGLVDEDAGVAVELPPLLDRKARFFLDRGRDLPTELPAHDVVGELVVVASPGASRVSSSIGSTPRVDFWGSRRSARAGRRW